MRPAIDETASQAQPDATPRRDRYRPWIVGPVVVVMLILVGLGAAYAGGLFSTEERSQAAPRPCSLLDQNLVNKVVPGGRMAEDGDLCRVEGPDPAGPKLTLTAGVTKATGDTSAELVASEYIRNTLNGAGTPVADLGDEAVAYEPPNSYMIIILMRVGRIVMSITGSASATAESTSSAVEATRAVAADAARRARAGR